MFLQLSIKVLKLILLLIFICQLIGADNFVNSFGDLIKFNYVFGVDLLFLHSYSSINIVKWTITFFRRQDSLIIFL